MSLQPSLSQKEAVENSSVPFSLIKMIILFFPVVFMIVFFGGVSQTTAPFSRTIASPVVFYPSYFATAILILIIYAWFSIMIWRKTIIIERSSLDIPLLFLILYVIVRAIISDASYLVRTELLNLVILAGFFYIALNIVKSDREVENFILLMIFSTLLISIYGIINNFVLKRETVLWLGRFSGYKDRVSATYICPNHFAGLLVIVIPFAFAYLINLKRGFFAKFIFSILILVMIAALALSQSRGGWAALTASLITVTLVSIRKIKLPFTAVILPALIIIVLLVFLESNTNTLYDRVTSSFDENDLSISSRKQAWIDTFKMAAGWHFLGSGPGTYEYAITRYQSPGFFVRINFAHNDYLQTLAEYGVIGFVLILSILFIIMKTASSLINLTNKKTDVVFIAGYIGVFIGIAVHSFVDFNMRIPANAILMVTLTGLLFAVKSYNSLSKKLTLLDISKIHSGGVMLRVIPFFLVTVFTLCCLMIIGKRYLGAYYHHLAREKDITIAEPLTKELEIEENIKQEVVDNYLKARFFDSANPSHSGALSNIFVLQGRSPVYYDYKGNTPQLRAKATIGLSVNEREELMERIVERVITGALYGEEAVRGNPMSSFYHLRLAQAYDFLGSIQNRGDFLISADVAKSLLPAEKYIIRAEEEYNLSVAQRPNYPYYHQELAKFYLRIKKYEEARQSTLKTIELYKSRPPWYVHPVVEVLERIAEAYINQGDFERASQNMQDALRYMPDWKKKSTKIKNMQEQIKKGLEKLNTNVIE